MTTDEIYIIDHLNNVIEDDILKTWLGDLMFVDRELTDQEKLKLKKLQIEHMGYGHE